MAVFVSERSPKSGSSDRARAPCAVTSRSWPDSPSLFCVPVPRDIQQETFRASHAHWRGFSFVYNHYLFSGCFLVVLLSILLYLLRLRRIHRRTLRGASTTTLWLEEGLPSQKMAA